MRKTALAAIAASAIAPAALLAAPAQASAPIPFPVHVATTGVLTTAHKVFTGERLMVGGHLVVLGQVDDPGPYVAHTVGLLPGSDVGRNFPAIRVG